MSILQPTIEDQARHLLNPVLGECVRQRTAAGVAKYGQRLDDNYQPHEAKAVHLVQELMDACQYALWMDLPGLASNLAAIANDVQSATSLTAEQIMAGGKQ
ncbi:hypothetical protein [Deinococcus aquatilis]|uniref:hypothetical protein n=1 Tax=Deinococcus aquatilis TaxID=519440 RepID=UPI00037236E1|nr:hypothetical protein [Deinococcus aquatilis]